MQVPVRYWPGEQLEVQPVQGRLLVEAWKVPVTQEEQLLSTTPLQVLTSCEPAGQVVRQEAQPRSVVLVGAEVWKEVVELQGVQA